MIAIVDYGAGNINSVKKALDYLDIESVLTDSPQVMERADGIIVPGVGAFPDAMRNLENKNLITPLKEQALKKPILGICLGMQILFDKGFEFEETKGLSLIDGKVIKLTAENLKIPHMGWNSLKINKPCALLKGIEEGDFVYFVHSYRADTDMENINAYTQYGEIVPALVSKGNVYGAQFHPEKSSEIGLKILKNFKELTNDNITCN